MKKGEMGKKKSARWIICPSFYSYFFLVLHLILGDEKRGNGKEKECEVDHLSSLIGVSHHHLPCTHPLKRLFLNNHQKHSAFYPVKRLMIMIFQKLNLVLIEKTYVIIFKSILNRPNLFVVCQSSGYWKFSISVPCDLLVLKLASYWTFNFGNSNNFAETLQSDGNFVWILQLNEQDKILMRENSFQKRKLSSALGTCP